MNIGWFGYGGNSWLADSMRDAIDDAGHKLLTSHEYACADVPYKSDGVMDFLDRCDVVILPARVKKQPSKGVNRLAIAWSAGKPCIVAPLDSYLQYVRDGENALIARSPEEFLSCIRKLEDPGTRLQLGIRGQQTAVKFFHPRDMIQKLLNAVKPKVVAVIIPHYSDRKDYLVEAVRSAFSSRGPKRHVVVSSSSKVSPKDVLSGFPDVHLLESAERLTFSQANNVAIDFASASLKDTTHYLFLNDDAILSQCALERMLEACPDDALLNPWSNCDQNWLHHDQFDVRGMKLRPGMTIEEVHPIIQELRDYSVPKDTTLHTAPFCAMYATLVPKPVLDKVGKLSEVFKNGGEDADYSYRAHELGFKTFWTKNAFVYHFGGKTRKFAEDQNHQVHHEEDRHNNAELAKRWGNKQKKVIGIWTGPAWEEWDIDTPYTTGIGGSETCAARLAEYCAAQGHEVHLIGNHQTKEQYGVKLVNYGTWKPAEHLYDLFIASRNLAPVEQVRAKKILVWCHDIWLLSGQQIPAHLDQKVTKYVTLSPWHQEFFMAHHKVPRDRTIIIPNGIDPSIYGSDISKKVYGKMHFSSSPDRGLDNIIYMLPFIRDQVPEIHLDVYYGFFNWKSAALSRNDAGERARIEALEKDLEKCQDIVHFKDRVNQKELASAWESAYVWGYPTLFTETYCITAMEAQLSGTPIVCSNVAALNTTVGAGGHLITANAYSREGRQEFIDQIVKVHKDKGYWDELRQKSLDKAKKVSWADRYTDYWSKWL